MKKKIIIVLCRPARRRRLRRQEHVPQARRGQGEDRGTIYILPKQFTANLKDGRYATVTVALVLAPGQSTGAAAGGEGGGAARAEGFGTLPEEAAVRDIITNLLTNQSSKTLTSDSGREHLKPQFPRRSAPAPTSRCTRSCSPTSPSNSCTDGDRWSSSSCRIGRRTRHHGSRARRSTPAGSRAGRPQRRNGLRG